MPITAQWHTSLGATMIETVDGTVVEGYGDLAAEYASLTSALALVDRSHRGRLRATESDRLRFFHAMCTQPIATLPVGRHVDALFCNKKGKVLAMTRLCVLADSLLIDVNGASRAALLAWLERHIIGDWVELADESEHLGCLSLIGDGAAALLERVGLPSPPQEGEQLTSGDALIVSSRRFGRPSVDLVAPYDALAPRFADWATTAQPVGRRAIELLEIERGAPRYGVDLTEENLPQEAGLDAFISYDKGCYVGQETIARLHYRGRAARSLVALAIDGHAEVDPDCPIHRDGEEVGRITRSAAFSGWGEVKALGYLKRDTELGEGFAVDGRRARALFQVGERR
ncbi:MAG: folate-binding protein YgfZ [Myxococcales bacterium]|nr:folate-binding protein YgfZ [Myxococcales bacterium]